MDLKGRVCVVSGGGGGIGKCIVREFAARGASVAFIDINCEAGEETLRGIKARGEEAFFFCSDVGKESELIEFTKKVIERYGRVDYLINNAGISKKGLLSDCSYEDFIYVLKVGVAAPYMLTKLFLPYFGQKASIVNISSIRAEMSQADTESYTAAKGGISALTHAMAVSLAGKARVNCISPGWIDTMWEYRDDYIADHSKADMDQHTSGRVGIPEDIANMVLFLCDDKSAFINGQNINIDGGMTKLLTYHNDEGWTYNPNGGVK